MSIFQHKFGYSIRILATMSVLSVVMSSATADTWRGTAPFCNGQCLANETQIGMSDYGDGGYCVTGHKRLCRNSQPTCLSKQTNTHCYGAVKMCENGFYETPTQNWHICSRYACGICFGISAVRPLASDNCKQGFVWREALPNDRVCVVPMTRAQVANDNGSAASRRANGGASGLDTCKSGFVWREAVPSDHVCVTPIIRAAAVNDNSMASQRRVGN